MIAHVRTTSKAYAGILGILAVGLAVAACQKSAPPQTDAGHSPAANVPASAGSNGMGVTVENDTGEILNGVMLSPPDKADWTAMTDAVTRQGDVITMNMTPDHCVSDLQVTFADNRVETHRNIDLCAGPQPYPLTVLGDSVTKETRRPDPMLPPLVGSVSLRSGFRPTPVMASVDPVGDLDAGVVGGDCAGFISLAPNYRVTYTAGTPSLQIAVDSETASTLIVHTPAGQWRCFDGARVAQTVTQGFRRPLLTFARPTSGAYDIWIGTVGDSAATAKVSISEVMP
ncbi:hypothetical protein BH10PSE2_BH10PSE2_07260 [soil metagenome]